MKFVIWGAGIRGKAIYDFLGEERIEAFIDENSDRLNTLYCFKKIIDLQIYIQDYSEYFIIVSPIEFGPIVKKLQKNDIHRYFILSHCPSEMVGYGNKEFLIYGKYECEKYKMNIIHGINLYSLILYKYLEKMGYKNLYLSPHKMLDEKMFKEVKTGFSEINFITLKQAKQCKGKIFITEEKEQDRVRELLGNNYVIENIFDFSNKVKEYHNKRIEKFKNIHSGKRCFIVATGPSLSMQDLDMLNANNEICMSMNRIYYAFSKTRWRPDYYVIQDGALIRQDTKEILNLEINHKFVSDACKDFWNKVNEDNIYKYHVHTQDVFHHGIKFSDDFSQKEYEGYTVTYTCLQLAVYMGFKHIYLLGVDAQYSKDMGAAGNHFYGEVRKGRMNMANIEGTLLAYKTAEEFTRKRGIKIYNATRGGELEVFERVEFDSLF